MRMMRRFRQAGDALPEVVGFVVVMIDGHRQAVLRQAEVAGDQVPGDSIASGLK